MNLNRMPGSSASSQGNSEKQKVNLERYADEIALIESDEGWISGDDAWELNHGEWPKGMMFISQGERQDEFKAVPRSHLKNLERLAEITRAEGRPRDFSIFYDVQHIALMRGEEVGERRGIDYPPGVRG